MLSFCAEIIHLGGNSAMERVLKKTSKPYTLDNIYAALKTDQADKSSNNQSGTRSIGVIMNVFYKWLKEKNHNYRR